MNYEATRDPAAVAREMAEHARAVQEEPAIIRAAKRVHELHHAMRKLHAQQASVMQEMNETGEHLQKARAELGNLLGECDGSPLDPPTPAPRAW